MKRFIRSVSEGGLNALELNTIKFFILLCDYKLHLFYSWRQADLLPTSLLFQSVSEELRYPAESCSTYGVLLLLFPVSSEHNSSILYTGDINTAVVSPGVCLFIYMDG